MSRGEGTSQAKTGRAGLKSEVEGAAGGGARLVQHRAVVLAVVVPARAEGSAQAAVRAGEDGKEEAVSGQRSRPPSPAPGLNRPSHASQQARISITAPEQQKAGVRLCQQISEISLVELELDELLQLEGLARDRVLAELADVRHDVEDLGGPSAGEGPRQAGGGS